MHHIAFNVSRAVFMQAVKRLDARGIKHTGVRDRHIFDAIYFEDPMGLLIELSCYKFNRRSAAPMPMCCSRRIICASRAAIGRSARSHLADAIEKLVARSTKSLSDDRTPKNPYLRKRRRQLRRAG